MNRLGRPLIVVLLVACAAPGRAAPPADTADLFPPGTLAYAEVANPAELAPQLLAVFKGTAFEDTIPFVHGRKDSAQTLMELKGKQELAALGLLASPEMLAEVKKLRVAAGLTGFTPGGEPDFAVVVLTADSPAAGLAARAFLTMSGSVRRVGDVSKVPVFQFRTPNINYDPNGVPNVQNDKPPTDGPHEPTFAYTPGLFVAGTSKTAVGHAIKRFLGEEKDGLAGVPLFKTAAAAHRQTGLFYFVNFPEFVAKYDAAGRARGGIDRGDQSLAATDLLAWFKLTANAKAVRAVAGSVRFRDGGVSATLSATFDPAHKSPLMEFLSGPGVKLELLHHARRPATLALGVTFPEKDRASAVVGFLDAVAKANGELGRLPGEAVREWEQKFKVAVAADLLGKTRGVTVILPTKQELPKGAKPAPMLVLHADDAATAAAWEDFLPKMVGDLTGAAATPQPSSETIGAVKVYSLAASGLRWNAPVHYARSGKAVAVGLDRKLVAEAVTADPAASVVGGDTPLSLPAGDPPAVFGTVHLGALAAGLAERARPDGPVVPVDEVPVLPNGVPVPEKLLDELKKARKGFWASLGSVPPAAATVRRAGNELRVEVFQPKVQDGGLKAVIDAAAHWLDRSGSVIDRNRNGGQEREIFGKW